MCLWPSTTPGSVSTSRSCIVSRCFWAKLRTCACANLMSSRSRFGTCAIARSISCGVRRKSFGDHLSNFSDSSRMAASFRSSTCARMLSTVSRTLASAALIEPASIPRLSQRGMVSSSGLSRRTALHGQAWPSILRFAKLKRLMAPRVKPAVAPALLRAALLDGLRIDRRSCSARDDQRRAAEEELIDTVLFAVLGKLLEIENFAHAQTHGRDNHPMPGLIGFGRFIGPDFHAPGVCADRGDLLLLAPVTVLELDAWCVAAREAAPFLFGEAAFQLPGADDDKIATSNGHILLLRALIEFVVGNAFAVLHPFHATKTRDIEQYATSDHLVLGMLDAEDRKSARVNQFCVVTVVGLVLIENMTKRVPVRGALYAKGQRVIGVADLVPVLLTGDGVGPGRQHLMDRIEAPAEQAGLGSRAIERNAQRKHHARSDQARSFHDIFGGNMVEGADLVFLAPSPPVLQFFRGFGDRFFADLDVHAELPSDFYLFAASNLPQLSNAILHRASVFHQAGCVIGILTEPVTAAHHPGPRGAYQVTQGEYS